MTGSVLGAMTASVTASVSKSVPASVTRSVTKSVFRLRCECFYEIHNTRNVKISEAPSHGVPILIYDILCAGAQAYASLAAEIIEQEQQSK